MDERLGSEPTISLYLVGEHREDKSLPTASSFGLNYCESLVYEYSEVYMYKYIAGERWVST